MHLVKLMAVVVLVGVGSAQEYQNRSLGRLEPTDTRVRVAGYFETSKTFSARIDGTLRLGEDVLEVRGSVFDWLPQDGTWVVVWGELKSEDGTPYLAFHNGHPLTETKAPRPAPVTEGERTEVWLNVSIVGAKPNTFYQGVSEDRQAFVLPDYRGGLGRQCLSGVVGQVGGRKALGATQPCVLRDP